jgi:hypothetical protein
MPPTLRYGLLLGFTVAAWTFVMGFTGWYLQPEHQYRLLLVIPLQLGVLGWALHRLAPAAGYGRQVWNGVSISVLGSMVIYAASVFLTTTAFPHYFQDMEALARRTMVRQGLTPPQIEAKVREQAPLQTPRANALAAAIGTVVLGFAASAALAAGFRKR